MPEEGKLGRSCALAYLSDVAAPGRRNQSVLRSSAHQEPRCSSLLCSAVVCCTYFWTIACRRVRGCSRSGCCCCASDFPLAGWSHTARRWKPEPTVCCGAHGRWGRGIVALPTAKSQCRQPSITVVELRLINGSGTPMLADTSPVASGAVYCIPNGRMDEDDDVGRRTVTSGASIDEIVSTSTLKCAAESRPVTSLVLPAFEFEAVLPLRHRKQQERRRHQCKACTCRANWID